MVFLNDFRIDEAFEAQGQFWLANRPEVRFDATLCHQLWDKLILKAGSAGGGKIGDESLPKGMFTIHGLVRKSLHATLENCFVVKSEYSQFGRHRTEFLVGRAFIGHLIPDSGMQPVFNCIRVESNGFREWYRPWPVRSTLRFRDSFGRIYPDLVPQPPPPISASIVATKEWVEIGPGYRLSLGQNARLEFVPVFAVHYPHPMTLDECRERFQLYLDLVSLFIGNVLSDSSVELEYLSSPRLDGTGPYTTRSCQFVQPTRMPAPGLSESHPFLPVPFETVAAGIGELFARWEALYERIRPTLGLLFSELVGSNLTWQSRFLLLSQAAEILHRAFIPGEFIETSDHETLIRDIMQRFPSDLPNEFRRSFEQRLRFSNQYSLRRRIQDLLRSLPIEITRQFCDKPQEFASAFVATRNYFTHWDDSTKDNVIPSEKLYIACAQMRTVLFLYLYQTLSLDVLDINTRLEHHPNFRYAYAGRIV